MTRSARAEAALIGALTADAATMGLHWLYDPERITALGAPLAFRTPDAADFEGAKGVFVHAGRRAGDSSQYGAQLRCAMQAAPGFDIEAAQARFMDAFGPGGWWTGYIDRPTRGAVLALMAEQDGPSGIEDDQLPAVSRLAPLLARPGGASEAELIAAMEITNLGAPARDHARVFAAALTAALDGASMADALDAGQAAASAPLADALAAARESEASAVDYAGEVGRHCHLPAAMPVIWRIAASAPDFRAAAEANIRAGGDNCGRAIPLGALLGAVHGVGGSGVPPLWIARLTDGAALAEDIAATCG
jgi:ADP-ribosylglycohydrolase